MRVGGKGAHLILEFREHPEVVHPTLLVERCNRFCASDLPSGSTHGRKGRVWLDDPQRGLDHLAAIVHLGYDPVGPTAPLPVINAAGSAAIDGSGTVVTGGIAQPLFAGVVPVNGFLVANNSSATLYVSDVGAASAGGGSIPIAPGAVFITPSGYKPAGVISLYASSTGQSFAARRW